jgi:hypothetical protein
VKTGFLKPILIALFIGGILALSFGIWLNGAYRGGMPKMSSHERPVELTLDHGRKVFVTQTEYDQYQKYNRWSDGGILVGMLAAFAYAWLKYRESGRPTPNQ